MQAHRKVAVLWLGAAAWAGGCAGHAPVGIEQLAPGREIRAVLPEAGVVSGSIVRQVNGYLDVRSHADSSIARVSVGDVDRIEMRNGRDRMRTGLLGMTAGFAVGVIGGMICMRACPRTEQGDRVFAPIYGAAGGAPLGFLFGAMVAPARWTPVVVH